MQVVMQTEGKKNPVRGSVPNRPSFLSFFRAGEGIRTLDVHLGKVALYH